MQHIKADAQGLPCQALTEKLAAAKPATTTTVILKNRTTELLLALAEPVPTRDTTTRTVTFVLASLKVTF